MKRAPCILILILALLLALSASADERDLYIDRNVQKIFTSENGMLSTSTQAVAQTSEGFIWIGGYGGLVRYDGRRFTTFAYKRITRVTDLAAGEDGSLYVATSDKGLFKYEDNDFASLSVGKDAVLDIECMTFAPDGRLYLGTSAGVHCVDNDHIVKLDVPGLANERIDRIACPLPDVLLCVTHSGCLFTYDGNALRQVEMGGEYVLRSICRNAVSGDYYVGTAGSEVLVFDAALNQKATLIMDGLSCINDLHCDADGVLWLCADNGIAIYKDESVRMQNLLMQNSVDRMMVDREGNYWFVSSRQGVLEVSRSQFGDVSQSAGLQDMVVNAIQRIGDTLYIGHDTGMAAISATDFRQLDVEPVSHFDGVRVRALMADSHDNLWIGTMKKGLFRFSPDGELVNYTSREYPALQSDNIRAVVETDAGVLFGTDKGAYLINDDGLSNVSNDPSQLSFRILSVARYGDTIYLGSDGNGFFLLKDGEIARRITTEDGLSSNVIMKAYRSEDMGGLWLVTGNNIDFLHDDGSVTSIESFPSTNNLDLKVMDNGDTWLFTGVGIYQTTEESLLKDESPRYLQYRQVDGLPYEVTPNSYQCMTDDMLYVCGSGGVFSLQTDFAQSESGEYQLTIDSVNADGQTAYIHPGAPVEIDSDVKRIDINAYVLTYQTGNPFVFYYLEGFDNAPSVCQLSQLGDISYTNLNGGAYTFHFGIRDYKTGDMLQEITLPIVKRHAWYENPSTRLIAALLGVLLLTLIVLAIIRSRGRRIARALQEEFEQKEKEHLQKIAYSDYLTGLYNRNYLDVWNAKPPRPEDYPVTFVSIDMNNLKKINDSYGHKDGDQLLCGMSNLLKKYFADSAYTIFRIGGDEFLVLARGVDGDTVRDILDDMAAEGDVSLINDIPITFAYGMCTQRSGEFDFDEGLRVSDLNMLGDKKRFHSRD